MAQTEDERAADTTEPAEGTSDPRSAKAAVADAVRRNGWSIVLFFLFAAVSAPVWWRLASNAEPFAGRINDFPHYVPYVEYFRFWPPRSGSPHFVYPMSVHVFANFMSPAAAATVVMSIAFGLLGPVLHRVAMRTWDDRAPLDQRWALGLPLAFLVFTTPALLLPASLTSWWARPPIDEIGTAGGVFLVHVWGSPPSTLQLPFALVLVVLLLDALHPDRAPRGAPSVAVMAVLTVVTTFAKPAIVLVLLVAVPLYTVIGRERPVDVRWRPIALGFLAPAVVCTAAQSLFLTSGVSPLQRAGVTIDPFWIVRMAGLDRPAAWAGALLVILCLVVWRGRYVGWPPVKLMWLAVMAAFVPTFILRETSERYPNDALAWTMVLATQMLLIFSIQYVLVELRDARERKARGERLPRWLLPVAAIAALYAAAGVFHYTVLVGVSHY